MPRMTRQESQQLTRQKLISAAEKEILRAGIYESSIRGICDAAGYTLGAFYSNFKDKDELLLEVVEVQTQREFALLDELIATTARLAEKKVMEKIAAWLHELQKNKILSGLLLEFEVYANHNASFRKRYSDNKKRWHQQVALGLGALFDGQGLAPKMPVMQMAYGLSALWSGFIIESAVPGTEPADKIIPLFLEALLESSKKKV